MYLYNLNITIMKKITLKISFIFALYKQAPYIFLFFVFIILSFVFEQYQNAILFLSLFFPLRALYGFIYYKVLSYDLYSDKLNMIEGVFARRKNFIELYRVKDYSEYQSLFMRIFGIMSIVLYTSDKTNPVLKITGIPKSNIVEVIRNNVETQRKIKGVREFD